MPKIHARYSQITPLRNKSIMKSDYHCHHLICQYYWVQTCCKHMEDSKCGYKKLLSAYFWPSGLSQRDIRLEAKSIKQKLSQSINISDTDTQSDRHKKAPNKAIKLVPEKAALSAVFNALLLPVFTGWKEQSQSKTSKRVIEGGWEWTWNSLYEDSSFTSRGSHG